MQRIQTQLDTALYRDVPQLKVARLSLGKPSRELSILSFGCSSGDELVTLRCLFPDARIHGCDIDPSALAAARAVSEIADVFLSDVSEIRKRAPYDLICAFSSLCINPLPKGPFSDAYPFSRFDDLIGMFSDCLSPGGIIALQNASCLFRDTSSARDFQTIRSPQIFRAGYVDLFSREAEHLLKFGVTTYGLHHEVLNSDPLTDNDLMDCLFKKTKEKQDVINLPTAIPEHWRPIAAWSRSNLQNLSELKKQQCIEILSHIESFVDESDDQVHFRRRIDRQKLSREGYIILDGGLVNPAHVR